MVLAFRRHLRRNPTPESQHHFLCDFRSFETHSRLAEPEMRSEVPVQEVAELQANA